MKIIEVKENKKQYLDLLLLADEQEDMVDRYLDNGKMYVLDDNGVKCECVITDKENDILEIKNIATVPEYQGKGYARALIEFIVNNYREQYAILQVGTGDSPLTIPFYEKCGFVRSHIISNFFIDNYDHPMGFKEGNLLEPSCGIGNFIGMLPDAMQDSKIYGVELDTISAGIAQQLYQKTTIAAQGFEETNLPDSFFDGVVGNVPFGDFKVLDKRYDKHKFLIHDYFFAKSLDKLRPGGVMALVTSKGTMDKETLAVRKYIAQRAELLGAIRLPNNTFKGNAGTEVVSDILILQKRDRLIDIEPDWVHLDTDENGIKMNSYFVQHPEMILGEMKMVSGRFGMEATCVPYENADLAAQLQRLIIYIRFFIKFYRLRLMMTLSEITRQIMC